MVVRCQIANHVKQEWIGNQLPNCRVVFEIFSQLIGIGQSRVLADEEASLLGIEASDSQNIEAGQFVFVGGYTSCPARNDNHITL